jgi:hypothetical protein
MNKNKFGMPAANSLDTEILDLIAQLSGDAISSSVPVDIPLNGNDPTIDKKALLSHPRDLDASISVEELESPWRKHERKILSKQKERE